MGDFWGAKKSMEKTIKNPVSRPRDSGEPGGPPALRTNTPDGDDRALTRLEALHYRAEGTVADIYGICTHSCRKHVPWMAQGEEVCQISVKQ